MKCQPMILEDGVYVNCNYRIATHVKVLPPGPIGSRVLPIAGCGNSGGGWQWNGSTEQPTLRPSVLTRTYVGEKVKHLCHSYITGGRVEFLMDSNHSLAGQTFDLLEVDEKAH